MTPLQLSRREQHVLALSAQGKTVQQIADELGIKVKTVQTYRGALLRKFDASSMKELLERERTLPGNTAPPEQIE